MTEATLISETVKEEDWGFTKAETVGINLGLVKECSNFVFELFPIEN